MFADIDRHCKIHEWALRHRKSEIKVLSVGSHNNLFSMRWREKSKQSIWSGTTLQVPCHWIDEYINKQSCSYWPRSYISSVMDTACHLPRAALLTINVTGFLSNAHAVTKAISFNERSCPLYMDQLWWALNWKLHYDHQLSLSTATSPFCQPMTF